MILKKQLEQQCTDWLKELGWGYVRGYNIAPNLGGPKRKTYKEVFIEASESV